MITKAAAVQMVRDASMRFVKQCAAVPDAWSFRPHARAWSSGDVAEHVAIATGNITRRLSSSLLASPITAAPDVLDEEIPYLFYRGDEPPNIATPTRTWTDLARAQDDVAESVKPLVAWAEGSDANLRGFGILHPVFGTLDGVQWLLFAAAHMERHRAQIIGLQREAAH